MRNGGVNSIYYQPCELCEPGSARGRLHAEVSLLEFSVLLPFSQGYRPGIGCCERVKGLGAVSESLAVGRPKPRLSHFHIRAFREKRLASPEGPTLLSYLCCPRDRRSSMTVSQKFSFALVYFQNGI